MKPVERSEVQEVFPIALESIPESDAGVWFFYLDVNGNLIAESESGTQIMWTELEWVKR